MSFKDLRSNKIPEVFKESSIDNDFFKIEFEMKDCDSLNENENHVVNDVLCTTIAAEVKVTNKLTGECVSIKRDFLNLPIKSEMGFKVGRTYKQVLDLYDKATGWYLNRGKSKNNDTLSDSMYVLSTRQRKLEFLYKKSKIVVHRKGRAGQQSEVSIGKFLKAITGRSYKELLDLVGMNMYFVTSLDDEVSVRESLKETCRVLLPGSPLDEPALLASYLKDSYYNPKNYSLNDVSRIRLKNAISFIRAEGCILAQEVNIDGIKMEVGKRLYREDLVRLDNTTLDTLVINKNNKTFILKKYPFKEDRLSDNELFTMVNMYSCLLDGFGNYNNEYELTDRIFLSYENKTLSEIRNNIEVVVRAITDTLNPHTLEKEFGILDAVIQDISINQNRLVDVLKDTSVKEAQIADNANPIAYLTKDNKVTTNYSASTPAEMVKIQETQMKHLDPIESPESDKIGKVHYPCVLRKIDENGFSLAPYIRVKNGKVVSEEPVYLAAVDTQDTYIAEWNEKFDKKEIKVMYNGTVITVPVEKVTLKGYSPFDEMGLARSCIPFQEFDNPKRLLMGANYFRQADPIIAPERPYVSTGSDIFIKGMIYTAEDLLEQHWESEKFNKAKFTKEQFLALTLKLSSTSIKPGYRTYNFNVMSEDKTRVISNIRRVFPFLQKTNKGSTFTYNLKLKEDNCYQGEDVVIYNGSMDVNSYEVFDLTDFGHMKIDVKKDLKYGLAPGRNLKIGYTTFSSSNIDDAIVINADLVYEHKLTTVVQKVIEEECRMNDDYYESFGYIGTTPPEPYIDNNGLPAVGTFLKGGSVVICKYRTNKDKNLRGSSNKEKANIIAKNHKLPNNVSGEVISAVIEGNTAIVTLADLAPIEVGDKMAGRYGNKGVVGRVVAASDMPFDAETGEPLDICLNPNGVPSRMNVGQIPDVGLGGAMRDKNQIAIVTPFKDDVGQLVISAMEGTSSGLRKMIDGRTGLPFDRPIFTGHMYMLKLEHRVNKKIHAINFTSAVNPVTGQPVKGAKNDGGQAFGEYESWCLEAADAHKVLQCLFTLQSDDEVGQKLAFEQIVSNPHEVSVPQTNNSDKMFQVIMRVFGVDMKPVGDRYGFYPLTDSATKALAPSPLYVDNKDSIYDASLFGYKDENGELLHPGDRWGWVNLYCEIIHPEWVLKSPINKLIMVAEPKGDSYVPTPLKSETLKNLIANRVAIDFDSADFPVVLSKTNSNSGGSLNRDSNERGETGIKAAVKLLKVSKIEDALHYYQGKIEKIKESDGNYTDEAKNVYMVNQWIKSGIELKDFIISTLPIIPIKFRPLSEEKERVDIVNQHYNKIFAIIREIKVNNSNESVTKLYRQLVNFIGFTDSTGDRPSTSKDDEDNFQRRYLGVKSDKQHGLLRDTLMSKRIHCSGRSVIIPTQNPKLKIDELGVPILMAVEIWRLHLRGLFNVSSILDGTGFKKTDSNLNTMLDCIASNNINRFAKLFNLIPSSKTAKDLFYRIKKETIEFLETQVALFGRQPSLHKFAAKAYWVRIVYTKAIQLNPLVCKGYNADFDGDQMYIDGILDTEAAKEAIEKLNAKYWVINPKDSSNILEHGQDMVLGCYYATILHNNVSSIEEDKRYGNIFFASSLAELETYVYSKKISVHDLACVTVKGNNYISTAGRILFNALLPDGFTDEPFTNNLKLPTIDNPSTTIGLEPLDPNNFRNLKMDGVVSSKGKPSNGMAYYSLSKYTCNLYRHVDIETCSDVYQKIMEFGFEWCDLSGITLSTNDLDIGVDIQPYIEEAKAKADKINKASTYGLVSSEGRKRALIDIYNKLTKFLKQDIVFPGLQRNNNFFILLDSGSRGNIDQIMQTLGIVGISMKTSSESLETPILNSYGTGLTSFEMFLASYGARMGVNSTQNDTAKAGYATRKTVFMSSGLKVVEEDCGSHDFDYDVQYDGVLEITNSLGKRWVKDDFTKKTDDGKSSFEAVLEGNTLSENQTDDIVDKALAKFLGVNRILTQKCVKQLYKHHARTIVVETEVKGIMQEVTYNITYEMDTTTKDQLLLRQLMEPVLDIPAEKYLDEADIEKIEKANIKKLKVRTMFTCRSHKGICSKCYGLKFDTLKLPRVGEYVGFESAQYIGEVAAQLSMSLFHKGGISGGANDGVAFLNACLGGGEPKPENTCLISKEDQYAEVRTIGKKSYLLNGNERKVVLTDNLLVEDGEYLPFGTQMTYGTINLNKFGDSSTLEAIRRRQEILLRMYHRNYVNSNLDVHVRHFEILTRMQTTAVTILDSDDARFECGAIADLPDVLNAINEGANITFNSKVTPQKDVIARYSGPMAAVAFECCNENLGNFVISQEPFENYGPLSQLAVGEDIRNEYDPETGELLPKKRKQLYRGVQENVKAKEVYEEREEQYNVKDVILASNKVMESADFDELDLDMVDDALDELDIFDDSTEISEPESDTSENDIIIENKDSDTSTLNVF